MKKLIIFGNTQMAEIADFYFSNFKNMKAHAFFVDEKFIKEDNFNNRPVIPFNAESIKKYTTAEFNFFIAIGSSKMNTLREEKYHKIKKLGYELESYISEDAKIFTKKIGDNCLILENNTIQYGVEILNNCIIWSGNHIGHHTKIFDNVFVTSHVVISGNCQIGNNTFLGVNSSIADNIKIKNKNFIGANCMIAQNTSDNEVFKSSSSQKMKIKTNDLKFKIL